MVPTGRPSSRNGMRSGAIAFVLLASFVLLLTVELNQAQTRVMSTTCYCGVQLDGPVSNADCLSACGDNVSDPGGNGDWGGPIYTGPTEEELHQKRQELIYQWGEEQYKPLFERWKQQNALDAAAKRAMESEHHLAQQREKESAIHRVDTANKWNDAAVSAYRSGRPGAALRYFRAAASYMPRDENIRKNLDKAQAKIEEQAKDYLKSVGTVLAIKSLSSKFLLFHPDPNVRMQAQIALVEESLKKITEASAVFVFNEHMNRGKVEAFRWEDESLREKRKHVARQHALWVNELVFQAYEENRVQLESMRLDEQVPGSAIRVEAGPAMQQLFKLSYSGFE